MKFTSAFAIGCLFCCASAIYADGPGTRAVNKNATPIRVAQVPSPDPLASGPIDAQAEIEEMAPDYQPVPGVGDLGCASAQVVFGKNRCPRPTMNLYTSPDFSYQIWAGYSAQRAREEMLRDQTVFSPCPGGFCCRNPLAGACGGKAGCVNGPGCGSTGGVAGCATGACGPTGCGIGNGIRGIALPGAGLHGGRIQGALNGCSTCDSAETPCDVSAQAAQQAPVLPMAAFDTTIELK